MTDGPMTPRREEFAQHAAENAEHDKFVENDIRLRTAASRAVVLFEREGWSWYFTHPGPPTRAQIREAYERLAEDVLDLHRRRPEEGPIFWASSGHLVVVLFDYPNEPGAEIRYMVEVADDMEPPV